MANPSPYTKLMALLAQAQANDELHKRAAIDHSQRHLDEQEAKRAAAAAAARTAANTNRSR